MIVEDADAGAEFVDCADSKLDDLEAAVETADAFGGVDVVVNNASIRRPESVLDVSEEDFRPVLDISLEGAHPGAQAAIRRIVESGDGRSVINVSSIAGLFGDANWPTYAASKGGWRCRPVVVPRLWRAGHPRQSHPSWRHRDDDRRRGAVARGRGRAAVLGDGPPSARYGQLEDIAVVAVFLASDPATYVTGESQVVDGGWTTWLMARPSLERVTRRVREQ